jgi:4-oxalocrotonate tautomerase
MPFVRITVLGPPLTREQVVILRDGATRLMHKNMRKAVGGMAILVEQVDGAWSIAGAPVALAAQVDVTIGAGTNTVDEKARFMAEAWELLRTVLGPELREETYVVLHEVDTRSYGRGGLSRAERDRRRTAVPSL